MPVNNLIQLRKGTGSIWTSTNPVLASGEPGFDITNKIFKIGDGSSSWTALSGINQNISAGTGIALSFSNGIYTINSTISESGGGSTNVVNYENNRLLTSDGTSTGINAEGSLTFDGSSFVVNPSGSSSSFRVSSSGTSIGNNALV